MTDLVQLHRDLGIPADYAASKGWPLQPEPDVRELTSIGADVFGREQQMTQAAARAWQAMRVAAARQSIPLQPVSAYRGVAYQADVIRRKMEGGRAILDILAVNATPGYSEHHTGRAIDITTPAAAPLTEAFEMTAAFEWLNARATTFGFTLSYPRDNALGMAYEPWHWLFRE